MRVSLALLLASPKSELTYQYETYIIVDMTTYPAVDEYGDLLGCVDDYMANGNRPCRGAVEYRLAPSGSAIARCERHNAERWERYEASELERYADSDVAPSWFDPSIAGERWDDDY